MKQKRFEEQVGMFIRVEPEIKEWIDQHAAETNESANAIVNSILIQGVKQHSNFNTRSVLDRTEKTD